MTKLRSSRGGAYESRGKFFARVTAAPQKRLSVLLPWATTLDAADARAVEIQTLVNRLRAAEQFDFIDKVIESAGTADAEKMAALERAVAGIVGGRLAKAGGPSRGLAGVVTFREFAERWTSGELHRLYPDHVQQKRSSDDDVGRLKKHVYPIVQDVPLTAFTLGHAQDVLRKLDPKLSAASRRQVAQLLHRVLKLASYPAQIISANPLPEGFLPRLDKEKAKAVIYPKEEAQLLACNAPDPERPARKPIALEYRVFWGFLAREGMRTGEASRLAWRDVDLAYGAITLDKNKTDEPRAWALDPGTAEALRRWKKIRKPANEDALVFTRPDGRMHDGDKLAALLRDHLEAAEITRPQLFERSESRIRVRAHDLRGVFVTYALAAGRSEAWVQDRTGHTTSQMLNKYRRTARTVNELGLGQLAPLHEAIPELVERGGDAAAASSKAAIRGDHVIENDDVRREMAKADGDEAEFRFRRREAYEFDSRPVHQAESAEDSRKGASAPEILPPRSGSSAAASPRARLIADLADRIRELALAGDVHAMRAAQQALEAIVAAPGGESAPVVDLAHERAKRGT